LDDGGVKSAVPVFTPRAFNLSDKEDMSVFYRIASNSVLNYFN
jgi:hypothetical protein